MRTGVMVGESAARRQVEKQEQGAFSDISFEDNF